MNKHGYNHSKITRIVSKKVDKIKAIQLKKVGHRNSLHLKILQHIVSIEYTA